MSITIYVDGNDRSEYIVSSERTDEYCNPGVRVVLSFSQSFSVETWDPVVLYEDGTKTFTGTVSRIEEIRSDERKFVLQAKDAIRRLREYFVVEEYRTAGEGVQAWLSFFANLAGAGSITYTDSASDPTPLEGMTMGRMFAWEIMEELLLFAGMDIWCDADGVLNVGLRMDADLPSLSISAGDNLSSLSRSRDSEPCRNAAIVYTVLGTSYVTTTQGWEIDDDDVRTMVVSSMYVNDVSAGNALARRMVDAAGPEHDIKRAILDGVDTDFEVGDNVEYDDGDENSGTGHVTTVISNQSGSGSVSEMHIVLDERCPKIGAGGVVIDGRDIIIGSHDFGVWRCMNIWDDTPIWYSLNEGLRDAQSIYGVPTNGGLRGSWFIRDPYYPNERAYWVSRYGIYETLSLEPHTCSWSMKLPHMIDGTLSPVGMAVGDPYTQHDVLKIRSTVAREGRYYLTICKHNPSNPNDEDKFVVLTNDRFETLEGGNTGIGSTGMYYTTFSSSENPVNPCWLMGDERYYYGKRVEHDNWWEGYGNNNLGGLAAWHKNDAGCFIAGRTGVAASNSQGAAIWRGVVPRSCTYPGREPEEVILTDNYKWVLQPFGSADYRPGEWFRTSGGWNVEVAPGLHVPYDGEYISTSLPNPGVWMSGGYSQPRYLYVYPGYRNTHYSFVQYPTFIDFFLGTTSIISNLPWTSAANCPTLQGALGTYSPDRDKVYCFSHESPSKFATSEDGCASWTRKEDAPFWCASFSGFPTSSSKVYVGRHPRLDPSGTNEHDIIAVTWDRGETWRDVTGDLWEKMAAYHLRTGSLGEYVGASGIVTIAPRYS